ncbi:hypothetical protein HLB23_25410 [Nocardia uniformis]|uniref:Uncharacterized protein n=1 Tax=Nocardia uniformis TaxID=53432 RepID=A0A849CB21_9NOCA|nr:hypothetical protein [Nocardia uniformis]NNH73157.1 hypothetical protein [Nocardia uniformis]
MTAVPFSDSERLLALGREAARELVQELATGVAESRTGVLRVTGDPGGDFHIFGGRIAIVDSPGAPGIADLLARPGRLSTGVADVRLVAMMAALDGAFAIAAGWLGSCYWQEPPDPPPGQPLVPGIDPGWLLLETERRLRALAHGRVSPYRNHLSLTDCGRDLLAGSAQGQWQDILFWVNGRRSCRDIALQLHRSLYAVTVDVVRMLDADALIITPPRNTPDSPQTRPASGRFLLPRRRRGASGVNDTLPPPPPRPDRPAVQKIAPVREQERTQ